MIKKFENFSSSINIQEIKDIFDYLIEDWELFDMNLGYQRVDGPQNEKIEFKYEDFSQAVFVPVYKILITNLVLSFDNKFAIYINLSGKNDFFRIRNDFLDDLDVIIKRLKSCGYKCRLLKDDVYSSKFVLLIESL